MTYPQHSAYPAAPAQYGAPYAQPPQPQYPPAGGNLPVYGSPEHQPGQPYRMPPGYETQRAPQAAPAQPTGQGIAAPPPPPPALRDGGTNGGGGSPKMRHLVGRTIIVIPKRIDDTKKNTIQGSPQFGQPQPEAYFDLVVVDGGPLQYGDNQSRNPSERRPNTHEIDTPCIFRGANDYGFGFVQAVREALDAGEAGRVGVVQQGTKGNFPYLITKCGTDVDGNARPDGDARFAAAMDVFGKIWADDHAPAGAPRQFVNPTPRSLVAPPPAQAGPQVNYGQPQPQAYPAQPGAYAAATSTQYPQPGDGPGVAPTGPGGMYMPPASAPPAPAPVAQVPPHVEAWLASLSPELAAQQRELFLANAAQQAGGAPPAPIGPGM